MITKAADFGTTTDGCRSINCYGERKEKSAERIVATGQSAAIDFLDSWKGKFGSLIFTGDPKSSLENAEAAW